MKKRSLSLLLVLVMLMGMLPIQALAVSADAVAISTAEGLKQLANAARGSSFVLTADITLPEDWTPVEPFYEDLVLDGNGYTITLNGAPLFGNMGSCTVSNLILDGQVTSDSNIASLATGGRGTIRNCVSYVDVTYTGETGTNSNYKYVAGLIARFSSSSGSNGSINNCVYAGTLTQGNANAWGSLANIADFIDASITNSIGVGVEQIGYKENMFSEPIMLDQGTNILITDANDFIPADYLEGLNTNRNADDLEWEIKDGKLSLKRTVAVEATEEELSALNAAIESAKTVDMTKLYTAESYESFTSALTSANNALAAQPPMQAAVTNATTRLTAAIAGLVERSLAAVDLSGQEVASITTVSGLEAIQLGKYYRLDADLTIKTDDWYFPAAFNAYFDGNGHTITLSNNNYLWRSLGPDAVVQNLGIKGAVSSPNNAGAIAQSSQGLIVNCWSQADVITTGQNNNQKHTGGLVGELQSGGAIVNSYVIGNVVANGSNANGSAGVLAGNTEANSLIQYGYGLTDNFKGTGAGTVSGCAVKTRADLYSDAFIAQLNQERGTYGKEWTLSSEGYPHLGEAGSYTPPEAVTITFTYHDGRAVTFKSDEGLTVSLQDAIAEGSQRYKVGTFSMDGAARWQDTIAGNKDILLVNEDGTLSIYKAGSAEVVAISSEEDGSKELARSTVTVVQGGAVEGFRLARDGQDVGSALTVQGSERVTLTPQILRDGTWTAVAANQVRFSHTGSLHRVDGTFYAEEPGTMTLAAQYMDQTVTVQITSVFVPVTSITPAPHGTYAVHQHNPNSENMGQFLDLTLSHGAGNVVVLPDNASYRDKWTMTSSDPAVAEYVSSMLRAVRPYKAGTVTLTAVVAADGQQPRVEGTSTIAIEYQNPVQSVSVSPAALTVKENEDISLPITFTGTKSGAVTEPAMDWTFASANGGEVEIVRDGALGVWEEDGQGSKPCVANPRYRLNGVTAGTVTVTGTPQDQTGGAQPVTFTVTVEQGAALAPADNAALTAAGIANGQGYLTGIASNYVYGSEWEIFSLRRSGQTIGQDKIDAYLRSVEDTYKNDPNETAMKPTTIARVAFTLGALGMNAADFRGLNFVEMLYTSTRIGEGGNEPMWALIALDSRGYTVPANAPWTRDKLITELIVGYQNDEGGFGLNDARTASVDMTAMAVQALAPYCAARQDVKESVDKALSWLRGRMSSNCGFDGNAESTAQVVLALIALDLDPVDSKNGFVRNVAVNLLTNLTSFAHAGGGYKHYANDQGAQPMSTTQVLMAFEAYRRFTAGAARLYDLTDAADIRSVLAQRLAEAAALREAAYTPETWAVLQTAVKNAQSVLDSEAASEAALQEADAALAAALTGLKKIASGGDAPGTPQDTMTVTFRLIGDTKHDSVADHETYVTWIRTMSVTIQKGGTVYDVFQAALEEHGLPFEENQTGYISGIRAPSVLGGYWLREFDNGPYSGWKYLVNGSYPGVSLRYYWPKDGDAIIWRYVDDHTDSTDDTNKWQEAEDVTPSGSGTGGNAGGSTGETVPPPVEIAPPVTADKKGQASVSITADQMEAAIAQTKKDGAGALVIAPQVRGEADTVDVALPKSSIGDVVKDTGADLTVKTAIADVTIPAGGLRELSEKSGRTVTISAGKTEDGTRIEVAIDGKTVDALTGGIAVSIPAEAEPGSVLVLVDTEGRETIIKKSVLDGKAVTGLVDGSCTVKVVDKAKTFADANGHWAKEAIAFASSHELFGGVGGGNFAPDGKMDRAMVATVLYRLEDAKAHGTANFTDVPAGTWYSDAVAWASENGIVKGTGDGFDPAGGVTREQLAAMLYRYAQSVGLDTKVSGSLDKFSDSRETSSWAKEAMTWAVGAGLIGGKGGSVLDPAGSATRAEVAAIMQRLVKLMVK